MVRKCLMKLLMKETKYYNPPKIPLIALWNL